MTRTRKTSSSYTGAFKRLNTKYHGGISEMKDGAGGCVTIATIRLRNVTARNVCMIATVALRERSFAGIFSDPRRIDSHSFLRSVRTRNPRAATVAATTAAVHT